MLRLRRFAQVDKYSAQSFAARSSADSSSSPAPTLSSACATRRALGIAITVGDRASTQARTRAWAETPRRAAMGRSTGCSGSFRLRRPPPVGL